jgi:hypothetical protein
MTKDSGSKIAERLREMMGPEAPCVSIYMPAHRKGVETEQDPIRLKNLLRDAEERLLASDVRAPAARAMLEPARRLLDDSVYWQHQEGGLALFLADGFFRDISYPEEFEALVVVAERFHLKPLLHAEGNRRHFYVLAMSQSGVKLLDATRRTHREIPLDGIPGSLEESVRSDEDERNVQFHTGAPPTGGSAKRSAIFFGHASPADDSKQKKEVEQYFRKVDGAVRDALKDRPTAPLVLAGVDYVQAIYRKTSEHPHLTGEGISGNPEHLSDEQLRDRAAPIAEPWFDSARSEAVERFHNLAPRGRGSSDLREILKASREGRIQTLFVEVNVQRWGKIDDGGEPEIRESPQAADIDLLDFAAVQTLARQGEVFALEREAMPSEAPASAVFRY